MIASFAPERSSSMVSVVDVKARNLTVYRNGKKLRVEWPSELLEQVSQRIVDVADGVRAQRAHRAVPGSRGADGGTHGGRIGGRIGGGDAQHLQALGL